MGRNDGFIIDNICKQKLFFNVFFGKAKNDKLYRFLDYLPGPLHQSDVKFCLIYNFRFEYI